MLIKVRDRRMLSQTSCGTGAIEATSRRAVAIVEVSWRTERRIKEKACMSSGDS